MNLLEMMQRRRSVRKYTDEHVSEEKLTEILQAGLLAPSSKGSRAWALVVVKEKKTLSKLSACRNGAAAMLENADAAVIVWGDENISDVWVEDCSIVMANMHLMADSLGVGSCWIQGRLRETADGLETESFVRELLGVPENYRLEAILSLGMPQRHGAPRELETLPFDKVHYEKY